MQQRDEGAAARQPHGRLSRGVAAPDHADALSGAQLALGCPRRVEDADPLVALEPVHRQAPVFGPGGEQHGTRGNFVTALEPYEVTLRTWLERLRLVGRGEPRLELARLGGRATGQ